MFNVGSGEFLIILLVALVVLGPTRLPGALRQVGQFLGEARKLSSNFQNEVQEAMKDPVKVVTGQDTPTLPKSAKDLVGFAVPAPFAAQKAENKDAEDANSEETDGESVIEPAALPEKKPGPMFHSAGPATPVVVEDDASTDDASTDDLDASDDPPVAPESDTADAGEDTGDINDTDDEIPMFGDR